MFNVELTNKIEKRLIESNIKLSLFDLHVLSYLEYAINEYDENYLRSWHVTDWCEDYKRAMFNWLDIHDLVEAGIYISSDMLLSSVNDLINAGIVKAEITETGHINLIEVGYDFK